MSDIRLHRTDRAETAPVRPSPERPGQRIDLQRIADDRSRAVTFDIAKVGRRDIREQHRFKHGPRLARYARGGIAHLFGAIVIDRRSSDHGINIVAVGNGGGQILQQNRADAAAENRALRLGVERAAVSVRRANVTLSADIANALRHTNRCCPGKRQITLAGEDGLAGQVHRDQRCRARRLHVDARSGEVELVGNPRAQKILVIADVRQAAGLARQLVRERQPIEEVAAHHAARSHENASGTHRATHAVTGILESLPGDFQQQPLLRIHQARFRRRIFEEGGIELVEVGENRSGFHVGRILQQLG